LTTSFSARDRRPASIARKTVTSIPAAGLALAALLAFASTPGATMAPMATTTASVAIGSYNIRAGVSVGTFESAVRAVAANSDVAGLQEVNSHAKEDVLRSLSASGWSYYRGKPGEQSPVIWNQSRFDLVSGRVARIADGHYIGNELPNVSSVNPMYATVVHLRDRATGANISVVNVHLVPGAVINGRATPGRPRLFAAFKEAVTNLGSLTRSERAFGRVFVLGDFNVGWVADKRVHLARLPFATFWRQSMRSMWATERPTGGVGSHAGSPALIDQVYSTGKATSASVRSSIRYSDHFPVIATYTVSNG
jgi:endonuclease/exonuclease/phosphatase family metal-dependent hydrolase